MRSAIIGPLTVVVVLGAAAIGRAQTPLQRSAASGLAAAIADVQAHGAPAWITYRVPMTPGRRTICFDSVTMHQGDADDLRPAGPAPSELVVFARIERDRIARLRVFTPDCPVESGGVPIVTLADVRPDDSVQWLAALVSGDSDSSRVVDPALLALSLHAAPAALTRLIAIARDAERSRVRGQALFWLAARAGDRAMAAITSAVETDPDTEVKKRAVFALSQLPKDEGVPKLIEVARTNRNPAVRKQAMFWLGQSNDPRAVKFFEDVLSR
jgi:HEAT repeat protein